MINYTMTKLTPIQLEDFTTLTFEFRVLTSVLTFDF